MITRIATYLPVWSDEGPARTAGRDEDAVTMGVEAGSAARAGAPEDDVRRVVFVTRDFPLLEGGNAAALLAGLDLPPGVDVTERVGGAPAVFDSLVGADAGTLVIGVDATGPAGAGAVWVGASREAGAAIGPAGRVHRSLPLRARGQDGVVHEDEDPRLQRERGLRFSLNALDLPAKPLAVAGLSRREAQAWCEGDPPELPTFGASAAFFALAALADERLGGTVAALDQASITAVTWEPGSIEVQRREPSPLPRPAQRMTPGPDMRLSFTAYDRAFESKLRWRAGSCCSCGTLAFPPRYRCLTCGDENPSDLVPLPRLGEVYTSTTIHTPVPGLASPYSLAVVQLDGVDVRSLVPVTDAANGGAEIGQRGRLVFRKMATRSGVADYGYAFAPDVTS